MCGRFVATNDPSALAAFFDAALDAAVDLPANYNTAPTTDVFGVVARADGRRHLEAFRWGLVPSWADDLRIGSRMINARGETLAQKPAFRVPFARSRLIVPMDGFYEWATTTSGKEPFYIHRRDRGVLAVAGLWTAWRDRSADPAAGWVHTCSVITTTANGTMSAVHDRMPVILDPVHWDEWLDPSTTDTARLSELLVPAPDEVLTMHRVGTAVNSVRNRGPELREPLVERAEP